MLSFMSLLFVVLKSMSQVIKYSQMYQKCFWRKHFYALIQIALFGFISLASGVDLEQNISPLPRIFEPLTEPPCSYCIEQHEKGLIDASDSVLAWIRGAHNGGAFPLKYFLNKYRVVNDTYGLFMYDPKENFIAAYQKDYGYQYVGRINGEMVVRGKDGTIWSAIKGIGLSGPQKGMKLNRIPNIRTTWGHWLLLHPESTTYDLFDGNRYDSTSLEGKENVKTSAQVITLGLDVEPKFHWEPPVDKKRFSETVEIGQMRVCLLWYGPTKTAVAYSAESKGKKLTFYADEISPLTAPFKDKETGTRWTLAGRAVDGPLRGRDLKWIPSIQSSKNAWIAAFPDSRPISKN